MPTLKGKNLLPEEYIFLRVAPHLKRKAQFKVDSLENLPIQLEHWRKFVEACASRPPSSYAPDLRKILILFQTITELGNETQLFSFDLDMAVSGNPIEMTVVRENDSSPATISDLTLEACYEAEGKLRSES